jgi:hypothetical protein
MYDKRPKASNTAAGNFLFSNFGIIATYCGIKQTNRDQNRFDTLKSLSVRGLYDGRIM